LHVAFVKRPRARRATPRRTNARILTIPSILSDKAKPGWRSAVAAQHGFD
jgi:hypothetical protein